MMRNPDELGGGPTKLLENIEKIRQQRMNREKERVKNCWQCGKELTTWEHPVTIMQTALITDLVVDKPDGTQAPVAMTSKVGGFSYICYTCHHDAELWTEQMNMEKHKKEFKDLYPEPDYHLSDLDITDSEGEKDAQRNET